MRKKIFKIFLFIILVLIIFIIAKFTYRYSFYQKLEEATQKVYDSGNYSCYYYMRGEKLDTETGEWTSSYNKMGLELKGDKFIRIGYDTEFNGYNMISKSYYDENNPRDVIVVDFNDNTFQIGFSIIPIEYNEKLINYAQFNNSPLIFGNLIDIFMNGDSTLKVKLYCLIENLKYYISDIVKFKIENITEDGKEYYVIKDINGNKKYINRDTLLVEKEIMNRDGEELVNAIFDIEIGNVKDEDLIVPDLTNFRQDIL